MTVIVMCCDPASYFKRELEERFYVSHNVMCFIIITSVNLIDKTHSPFCGLKYTVS